MKQIHGGVIMINLTCCGDDCNYCPRFLATQDGTPEKLKSVSELWLKCGFRDEIVANDEISCYGCTPSNKCSHGINKCCFNKKIQNCGECIEYPCEMLNSAFEKTNIAAKNCLKICTKEEYELLYKAFFLKKQNLDKVFSSLK